MTITPGDAKAQAEQLADAIQARDRARVGRIVYEQETQRLRAALRTVQVLVEDLVGAADSRKSQITSSLPEGQCGAVGHLGDGDDGVTVWCELLPAHDGPHSTSWEGDDDD